MRQCGVRTSPLEFITEVSNAYHEIVAPHYDVLHREIVARVTPLIQEFGSSISAWFAGRSLRVLDVGCGTGFASEALLQNRELSVSYLVCSDISPHMLDVCRAKLNGRSHVRFVQGDIEFLSREFPPFDVIVTCSVIHHLPVLSSFFAHLKNLLVPGGAYMMLHEPSRRFYENPECLHLLQEYQSYTRLRAKLRYFNPLRYLRKAIRLFTRPSGLCLESKTSELLVERKLISRPLTKGQVRQLVDIHVPPIHSDRFHIGSQGFDLGRLAGQYLPGFSLTKFRSYGFLGTEFEDVAAKRWQARARRLARLYPDDGAQFGALWRREKQ
jgi:2-polyprenyl-3-methyl-5-hydroxy-6-metoxy-1,4-benzoquinol methylase